MSKLKLFKILAVSGLIFVSLYSIAQALTYQQIVQGQTGGMVLGASTTVTPGTGTSSGVFATSPESFSVTVAPGSNIVLFVSTSYAGSGSSPAACTYNGVAMTQLWNHQAPVISYYVAGYILINPATGSNTLQCTYSANPGSGAIIWAQPFYGVSQAGGAGGSWRIPPTPTDGDGGGSSSASITATTVAGDMVVDIIDEYSNVMTAGGSQTVQKQQSSWDGSGSQLGVSTQIASGSSTAMQWSWTGTGFWAQGAVALIPVSTGGLTPTPSSTPTPTPTPTITPTPTPTATPTPSPTPTMGSQPWSNILSPTRGTNWTGAGVTGGIPSSSWTQCGPTIPAYNGNTDVINGALNHQATGYSSCGANTYIQLGAGTFNLTTGGTYSNGIVFKSGLNNTVLRGMGANQTLLVFASGAFDGCGGGVNSAICINGSAGAYWVQDAAATWSAGYAPGTSQITINVTGAYNANTNYSGGQVVSYNGNLYVCEQSCMGNTPVKGYVPWSNISPNDTIIGLDQCSSGNSGSPCSSNPEPDTGNYWDCDVAWASGIGGCAVDGPDGGNQRLNRPQNELFQVSAVNAATGQLTLIGSLRDPNWSTTNTPQVFIGANPDQYDGLENLSIDASISGSNGIGMLYTANSWVHGVRIVKPGYAGIWLIVGVHDTVEQNYIYGTTKPPGADSFGLNAAPSSDNLLQNNIIQGDQVSISNEGADSGSVYAYNFLINDYDANSGIYPAIFPHAGDRWQLFEGNVFNSYYGENYHGPKIMDTLFRNLITGWESCANGQCGSATAKGGGGDATTAVRLVEGSRYENAIGNVLGTPGYHNSYSTTNAFADLNIYEIGSGNGSIPIDPIVGQTFLRWGNYDTVTGGTKWDPTEVPSALSLFANPVPPSQALPASFYLLSKPSWWGNQAWPAIGPDVSNGSVGQCSGTLNVAGKYNGVAATNGSQCAGSTLNSGWAGHVSAIPAMSCFLNVMDGPPDGTGPVLTFNASSCYGTNISPTPTPTPVITSFQASPSTITYGNSTNLQWSVTGATSLSINNNIGTVTPSTGSGSTTVTPLTTTTYTLTATGAGGTATAQFTVTVNLNPDVTAPTVTILNPSSGTQTGTITFSANASDPTITGQVNSGLKLITLSVDGTVFATSSSSSASKALDTTTLTNTSHTLIAQSLDNAGNLSTVASVTITVNNTVATKYPRTITLTSLEGISTIPSNQAITVTIISPSSGTTLETQSSLTPTAGKYTVTFLSSDPQLVNIRVKANGYLSQLLTNIDTTVNSSSALSVPQLTAGDFNNDNVVNSLDYSLMNSHWLMNYVAADINADGIVNSLDFAIFKNDYNKTGQ